MNGDERLLSSVDKGNMKENTDKGGESAANQITESVHAQVNTREADVGEEQKRNYPTHHRGVWEELNQLTVQKISKHATMTRVCTREAVLGVMGYTFTTQLQRWTRWTWAANGILNRTRQILTHTQQGCNLQSIQWPANPDQSW